MSRTISSAATLGVCLLSACHLAPPGEPDPGAAGPTSEPAHAGREAAEPTVILDHGVEPWREPEATPPHPADPIREPDCPPGFAGPHCETCADPAHAGAACDHCRAPGFAWPECDACAPDRVGPTCAPTWRALALSATMTCALDVEGLLACAGPTHAPPVATPPSGNWRAVSVGRWHACALTEEEAALTCWSTRDTPLTDFGQLEAPRGAFRAVAAGARFTCAIYAVPDAAGGPLACWGEPPWGAERITGRRYVDVVADGRRVCAQTVEGEVACAGPLPPSWAAPHRALDVDLDDRLCSLDLDGELVCGRGDIALPRGPFVEVRVASDRVCGLTAAGEARCTALGITPPLPDRRWRVLDLTEGGGCGLDLEGALTCWGSAAAL